MSQHKNILYTYKNCPIPGGGFVTGFVFHPKQKNILYARTDIGGTYRYDFENKYWQSLIDHVTAKDLSECYPLSIALRESKPNDLYIACGNGKEGKLCVSHDRGESFKYYDIPAGIHGTSPGRGTGERLQVTSDERIYFGSQTQGLLRSNDGGASWESIIVCESGSSNETNITFVWLHPSNPNIIVVATSGQDNSTAEHVRGTSLYISTDAGASFKVMQGQPNPVDEGAGNYSGYVGQRASFDGKHLYITLSSAGTRRRFGGWSSYACDSGNVHDGAILRYTLNENGVTEVKDISPTALRKSMNPNHKLGFGIGGICADLNRAGVVICSTQGSHKGEYVLYSKDYGESWKPILHGLDVGKMHFTVPYMKPEYNGNDLLIHWMSDIKIDPFCSDRALFNTGTGIFMTENLAQADTVEVEWSPQSSGVEETVHLNVYSPPEGDVRLIDIVGDLGAFAFSDLDNPCENSFADKVGNRYITCMNADFPDQSSNIVVVTPRGNWTGKTTGGVIISDDQCKSFTLLKHPFGLTDEIDKLLSQIIQPNTNSGWVAITADASTIVWSIANIRRIPITAVVHTHDRGESWAVSKVYDLDNKLITDSEKSMKVMSDRVNRNIFYGFGENAQLYVSTDKGETFHQRKSPLQLDGVDLAGIDGANRVEVRCESGKQGVIWLAAGSLWRIEYNVESDGFTADKISGENDIIRCQGMGKNAPDSEYKTLYVSGTIKDEYGFFRSHDDGKSWERINSDKQMYGAISSICGDPRTYGRIYIATGSRGVLYGQPK